MILKSQIRKANVIARAAGFNRATRIVSGKENKVIDYVQPGYRKYSNNQYVSNAYRNNFGWKNTYYQHAICVVSITADQKEGMELYHDKKTTD